MSSAVGYASSGQTPWITVEDFAHPGGWSSAQSHARSRTCCEQLEQGQILFFPALPFAFADDDQQFLLAQRWLTLRLHKNVSYRPSEDRLRGFDAAEPIRGHLHRVMRDYSRQALDFVARFLLPYAGQWSTDYASFRPIEEHGRQLPLHKRNDLLHVDAFPSRPTRGARILRIFTNLHPTKPRVWLTGDRFADLASRFASDAGLETFARSGSILRQPLRRVGRLLGVTSASRSPYDRFMLRFHDYLKENSAYQSTCAKTRIEFPPLATWLVFTDGVPHAALSGQFALEQTLIIPLSALVAPQHAPIRILESLCGRPLAA